ncbi:MAG: serine O-acetyltransferase [Candidatus Lokiarchaeota archaeon]|nr:serine O-acetyltransferase [Candidatus Lokiarchaeota archaeon]
MEQRKCECLFGSAGVEKDSLTKQCRDCISNLDLSLHAKDKEFIYQEIEKIFKCFINDVTSAFDKDPAARSISEILTSYPGIQAVLIYRVAHFLDSLGLPFVPRFLSHSAFVGTGIDIHPSAVIGDHFFIDHGSGVVIGETAEIGENVTLYQNVTLGGVSLERKKRHPTLKNNIIVGAGAKILGPITIGNNVRIGANSVVTKDIPDDSVVVGVPGRILEQKHPQAMDQIEHLKHGILPDPIIDLIKSLETRLTAIEQKLPNK